MYIKPLRNARNSFINQVQWLPLQNRLTVTAARSKNPSDFGADEAQKQVGVSREGRNPERRDSSI